ncbi:hypothetical protein KR018_009685 [Drosophila ironensis]|nr:hypothetical protein KR018_009685 [Drosophila ironensis]
MSGFKVAYACRFCGNIIGYKSAKAGETRFDVLMTSTHNLILEHKIRVTGGEKFQIAYCSKCRMEMGMLCLESESNEPLKGITLLQKGHLLVYDSYEVPFELP